MKCSSGIALPSPTLASYNAYNTNLYLTRNKALKMNIVIKEICLQAEKYKTQLEKYLKGLANQLTNMSYHKRHIQNLTLDTGEPPRPNMYMGQTCL